MSHQDNLSEENTSSPSTTTPAEFGNEEWYAAHWKSHWHALMDEIIRQEWATLEVTHAKIDKLEKPYLAFDEEDYIKLTKPINPDFSKGFTVEVWVRFEEPDDSFSIIDFSNGDGKDTIRFTYDGKSKELCLKISDGQGKTGSIVAVYAPKYSKLQHWQHLAATVDENGTAVLYVNGQRQPNSGTVQIPRSTERKINYIGRCYRPIDEYSHGGMRELRVWNTARTQQQLQHYKHKALHVTVNNDLVGYWPFDEGDGDIASDRTGNGDDGQLGGNHPAHKPTWTRQIANDQEYIILKHLEAGEIAQSLRFFVATWFRFFYNGFYRPLSDQQNSIGNPQVDRVRLPNEDEDVITRVKRFEAQIEKKVGDIVESAVSGLETDPDVRTRKLNAYMNLLFYSSQKYTPNFVLRSLVEQSSHDLNLLQQISFQRSTKGGESNVDTFRFTEELGRIALQPAIGTLLAPRYRTVFCYLSDRTSVRLLPYHNTVLMGVPRSTTMTSYPSPTQVEYPMTLTAIPHEIGHLIYRFGHFPLTKGKLPIHRLLQNRLLAQPYALQPKDWRFQWAEEIFADAYGCLVAGPIAALGFQIMLADGLPQPLSEHLGDHPFPVLRPLIQSRILCKVRTQYSNPLFQEASGLLETRWQNWVAINWPQWVAEKWLGDTDQTDLIRAARFVVRGETMTGQQILDTLEPLIDVILQILERIRPESKKATWTPEWKSASDTANLAGLYSHFIQFAADVADEALSKRHESFQADHGVAQGDQILSDLLRQFEGKEVDGWRARSMGIDGLIEMILFEGWSKEGPQGEHER